ncbi:MAG: flavodoxin family protein [Erysipelotrichales bacterium]
MKVLIINGSPNALGNTYEAATIVESALKEHDLDVEIYNLSNKHISYCNACSSCYKTRDNKCIIKDDLNDLIEKCIEADGIILGAPIHYADISGLAKNAFDRLFYVSSANGNIFRHKVGASFVAVRRTGGVNGYNTLNNYLLYSEMLVAGSTYWNVIYGQKPKEVHGDAEGVVTLQVMADNIAYLLKMKEATNIEAPAKRKKAFTNFVRKDLL